MQINYRHWNGETRVFASFYSTEQAEAALRAMALEAWKQSEKAAGKDRPDLRSDFARQILGSMLRKRGEDDNPIARTSGPYCSLVIVALYRVDWDSIANEGLSDAGKAGEISGYEP